MAQQEVETAQANVTSAEDAVTSAKATLTEKENAYSAKNKELSDALADAENAKANAGGNWFDTFGTYGMTMKEILDYLHLDDGSIIVYAEEKEVDDGNGGTTIKHTDYTFAQFVELKGGYPKFLESIKSKLTQENIAESLKTIDQLNEIRTGLGSTRSRSTLL